MTTYVEKGDIILLEKGMKVQYPLTPIRMYKNHSPYSKRTCDGHWEVGIKRIGLSNPQPVQEFLTKSISFLFSFQEVPLDQNILHRFITHQAPNIPQLELLISVGHYLVTDVIFKERERKVFCETYRPEPGAAIFKLYFYQDSNNIATIDRLKIMKQS
ncbi:MAG: hypothetical protein ABIN80_22955 [Dyadobacter sp.]|uniref:hypothetical protein n=1 Tax=Dyadobacter sp. TaxID=1914288 RepID=UPI0032660D82